MREFSIGFIAVLLHEQVQGSDFREAALRAGAESTCKLEGNGFRGKVEYCRPFSGDGGIAKCSASKATVAATYDPKTRHYFVDYASIELMETSEGATEPVVRHYLSPGETDGAGMGEYALGSSRRCEESIIKGAKNLLKDGGLSGFYRKLQKYFEDNSKRFSPLIIARYLEEAMEQVPNEEECQTAFNGNIVKEHPVSIATVLWSHRLDYAYMNSMMFVGTKSMKPFGLTPSPSGLALVRAAWKKMSLGNYERFSQSFNEILLDVAKELLRHASVRSMANRKDWNLEIKRGADAMFFAEMLIVAVATDWDKKLKQFLPRQYGVEIVRVDSCFSVWR
ncbi:hypothetical protein FOZ61_005483 [Perkinsus olseni]|uniref:Uncharacterized protein n=1 Tax=Perkinsus olseni TaxID=32597 RepID=A0A7J6LH78_PEROL|nr:hypothetical protein FOZ61_005483 [Perkinsus olseni]KAF4663428.1 hypothetical protein FOL46_004783 [Perkinsus olseni]